MVDGRVEFRAKLPANGPYWWPACWLLATNYAGGSNATNHWPECGEIDVMESKGSTPNKASGTLHHDTSGSPGNDDPQGGTYTYPSGDGTTNFHTYVLSWATNSIGFGIDTNALYYNLTSWSSSIGAFPAPFNHPFYIIVNLAVGGTYFSTPPPSNQTIISSSTFPAEMDLMYVRVYQNVQPLQISGVSPTNGCMSGGATITISGSNFLTNSTVTVGGVPATSVVFVNTNTLRAVTPANVSGPMSVVVSAPYIGPSGTNEVTTIVTSTLTNGFTYFPGPSFAGLASATPATSAATLTWSAASGSGPFTYDVFETTTRGGENYASPLLTTNSLSAFITPLSLGSNCSTTYYFVVEAVDSCGVNDGNTNELAVQLLQPGPAFAGLSGIAAAVDAATLTWSTASGLSPFNYNVYEATTSGGENLSLPTLTTNGLSTLVSLYPGSNSPITYFFIVRAQDMCGNIDSNTVEMSIQPLLNPYASQVGDGIANGWKQQYGLNPFDPTLSGRDLDGTGFTALQDFLAGLDPTNPASAFRIVAINQSGGTITVTWLTSGGDSNAASFGGPTVITNIVQGSVGSATGGYSNNFSDISGALIIVPAGNTVTNYSDTSGTNQFYRIRLGP
jgi:hypothetical protein